MTVEVKAAGIRWADRPEFESLDWSEIAKGP